MKKYIALFIESQWHILNIDDFEDYKILHAFNYKDTYITSQVSDLIQYVHSMGYKSLPKIIDLQCFDKQMAQEGKEFIDYERWTVINSLKHHHIIDSSFLLHNNNFREFLEHIANLYITLTSNLEEKNRFESIELPINKIIYKRQKLGVRLDHKKLSSRCRDLELSIYKIKNELQFKHNIFTPDDEKFQITYLKSKGYNIVQSIPYTFKIWKTEDTICNLLYNLKRNQKDLESLLFMLTHHGGKERTHSMYLGFGTITSRIILKQPALQNLRRTNRDIIIADKGYKLLYIDYSQFEAGILATLSKDKKLIELYKSDIYTDIANNLLNEKPYSDHEKRKVAKIIFYRYMYGDKSLNEAAQNYFLEFKSLTKYRNEIDGRIQADGKVGTSAGNFRKASNADLLANNTSWSLSHVIQSTAALIYKNAVIRTNIEVPTAQFLIPLHDATLYQLNVNNFNVLKSKIETIYKQEFEKVCKQISARINFNEFYEP
ncbi:DNA polymerase [Flavobacterium sp. DG1-102-2]|uniref:DNA polymerase n=1 Tax=Flavobacterium sp. DG1-102-2 TaxID=3081663 RepID=UPI002948E34E|nr:DNA polymerase [Flavobacterium sp. DG1-102-2]MDV6169684.1 DNA polymerase [Flavobacterium sp. DG1-102-2]